jgi:hypothetical protein
VGEAVEPRGHEESNRTRPPAECPPFLRAPPTQPTPVRCGRLHRRALRGPAPRNISIQRRGRCVRVDSRQEWTTAGTQRTPALLRTCDQVLWTLWQATAAATAAWLEHLGLVATLLRARLAVRRAATEVGRAWGFRILRLGAPHASPIRPPRGARQFAPMPSWWLGGRIPSPRGPAGQEGAEAVNDDDGDAEVDVDGQRIP